MNCINDFNKLIDFINQFPKNFAEKLDKCYHISTKPCPYNPNWFMFSYSQFESDFTNPVVRASRGTVLEIVNGKVVRPICLPFYKFNNLGQEGCDEVDWDKFVEVQLKVDGNLIKVVKIDGGVFVFTNGAWAVQEVYATGLAGEEPETDNCHTYWDFVEYCFEKENFDPDTLPENTTLMFELVGPKTRVIVHYPETKLWFLGARDNLTMKEYNRVEFKKEHKLPFDISPTFDINNVEDLEKELATWEGDREGVVICDENFRRIKVKTDAYKQLKFIKGEGNFSEKAILESVIEGTDDDAAAAFPVLKDKINEIKEKVVARLNSKLEMWKTCQEMQAELVGTKDEREARKDFYFWAREKFSPEDLKIILLKGNEDSVKDFILKSTTLENI